MAGLSFCLILILVFAVQSNADDPTGMLDELLIQRSRIQDYHFVAEGLIVYPYPEGRLEVWSSRGNLKCEFSPSSGGVSRVLINSHSAYYNVGKSDVLRLDEKTVMQYIPWFESSSIGLELIGELGRGFTTSELVTSMQRDKRLLSLKDLPDGRAQLVYGPFPLGETRRFLLDPAKQFSILECNEVYPNNELPSQRLSVEWKQVNEIFVPTKVFLARGPNVSQDFTIRWHSVGEPLEPSIFDPMIVFKGSRLFVSEVNGRKVGQRIQSDNPVVNFIRTSMPLHFVVAAVILVSVLVLLISLIIRRSRLKIVSK